MGTALSSITGSSKPPIPASAQGVDEAAVEAAFGRAGIAGLPVAYVLRDVVASRAVEALSRYLYDVDVQASNEVLRDLAAFFLVYAAVLTADGMPKKSMLLYVQRLHELRQRIRENLSSYVVKVSTIGRQRWYPKMVARFEHALLSCMTTLNSKYGLRQAVAMYRPGGHAAPLAPWPATLQSVDNAK